ncbi:hypothetical protein ACLB2K_049514 [Fragaria x ananassa]
MAGQQEENDLGLSLGGLYKGNSAGAHRARPVSEENEVAAAPRAGRAASLPTEREMELMREGLTEVQALSRVMAASLKLTIQKERTDGALAAAARLPGLVSAGGRLAATSSIVSGELMSTDGSSNRPAVTSPMMAKENADDPQQDPARRARFYNLNVFARPIRRYRRNTSMPHVKTIGADGKRVEGYLYKYLTGKVRIVCLCHGLFQSPAEFVNHAGGNVVGNPLKQITVSI